MRAILILALLLVLPAPDVQPPADGTLLERAPCPPLPPQTYDEYVTAAKQSHQAEVEAATREGRIMTPLALASREDFERGRVESAGIACERLRYASDGLSVVAYMWTPKDRGTRRLPLLIVNRGGNREFAKLPPWHSFHRFAAQGFAVIGSQYRGNDGGEGQEEFGGADVRDVINLVPLARSFDFVDSSNVFMLGWSRGGMMTYLALKQGMAVNAAAVGGGLVDLEAEAVRRPQLVKNVWSQLMPGFAERPQEALRERSVLRWAEQLTTPLLLMHGTGDWRADPADTLALAQKLQAAGRPYELILYQGDDHGISANKQDSNRRIVEWFRKHMK